MSDVCRFSIKFTKTISKIQLPKFLKIVKIIQYYSILFNRVLTRGLAHGLPPHRRPRRAHPPHRRRRRADAHRVDGAAGRGGQGGLHLAERHA